MARAQAPAAPCIPPLPRTQPTLAHVHSHRVHGALTTVTRAPTYPTPTEHLLCARHCARRWVVKAGGIWAFRDTWRGGGIRKPSREGSMWERLGVDGLTGRRWTFLQRKGVVARSRKGHGARKVVGASGR